MSTAQARYGAGELRGWLEVKSSGSKWEQFHVVLNHGDGSLKFYTETNDTILQAWSHTETSTTLISGWTVKEADTASPLSLVLQPPKGRAKEIVFAFSTPGELKLWFNALKIDLVMCTPIVFGIPIAVAAFKNGKYPIPLAKIVEYLRSVKANTVDGIFRLSAATTSIQRAKEAFDRGEIPVYDDVLTAANLLKLYFMELPDCLLTYELYDSFLEAGRQQNTIVPLLKGLVNKLPRANQYSLAHLLELLAWIAASSDKNKMNSYNLAVVFGPTLLHNKEDNAMMQSSTINFVCQSLIDDYTQIFAGVDTSIPLDPPQIP